jgi:hypothetical protein
LGGHNTPMSTGSSTASSEFVILTARYIDRLRWLAANGTKIPDNDVHKRPTNALILFKVYSLSYLLLHVSASSMPYSGSLHMLTKFLVSSQSLIKFCTMMKVGLVVW